MSEQISTPLLYHVYFSRLLTIDSSIKPTSDEIFFCSLYRRSLEFPLRSFPSIALLPFLIFFSFFRYFISSDTKGHWLWHYKRRLGCVVLDFNTCGHCKTSLTFQTRVKVVGGTKHLSSRRGFMLKAFACHLACH